MARSERYKLLWSPDETQRRFYDLQTDPLETTNLLDDKNCAREIARHRAALANWALFEAVPPNFLDSNAPLAPDKFANAGDVAAVGGAQRDDEQRESARAWSAKKFAEYLAGA